MNSIYLFLIRNDVWIYILSVLGLFWYLTELVRAQAALRRAMFNLERETATRMRNHALSFVLFLSVVIGIVYYVNSAIAPQLPRELTAMPTATPDIFATPLPSPTPLGTPPTDGQPDNTIILAPTATLPGEAVSEPITTTETVDATLVEATPITACTTELRFDEPLDGSVAFGRVRFRGTANTGALHKYIIELSGRQTDGQWAPITQEPQSQPVVNGDLGEADLSLWAVGPYQVQLRALDANGAQIGVCTIQMTLDG